MEMDRKCLVNGCQMRALERNRDAWKIVEGSMPGNCQGRHAKEVKNKSSRQLTGHGGKGKERTGRGARWPAVSLNPATGRDRAAGQSPLGLTFRYKAARPVPPTMRGPCSDHAGTFWAGPSLIRGEGFADWLRRFL